MDVELAQQCWGSLCLHRPPEPVATVFLWWRLSQRNCEGPPGSGCAPFFPPPPTQLSCKRLCSLQVRGNKHTCLLAEQNRGKYFTIYKPNIGKQTQLESLDSLPKKYRRVGWVLLGWFPHICLPTAHGGEAALHCLLSLFCRCCRNKPKNTGRAPTLSF